MNIKPLVGKIYLYGLYTTLHFIEWEKHFEMIATTHSFLKQMEGEKVC